MQAHDLDAPNLDILHEPRGKPRLFLEDDPRIGVEDDRVECDAPISVMPSERTPSASVVFVFLGLFMAGVGGALAWWYYGGQATYMIRASALPSTTSKPTTSPEGFAELKQQLKSIATDLATVRNTLEQQSAANHDQLTRIQKQITQQNTALLSSSPHVSTQDSSKPVPVAPQLPPKQ